MAYLLVRLVLYSCHCSVARGKSAILGDMTSNPETAFLAAYNRLNEKQRAAVDAIEGPVMVIAGPGTGKTQILTLRIANILRQTDTAPSSILALTFTKSGARAMRERLVGFIGARAYDLPIFTFHGLAERLIAEYPTAYDTIIGGQVATEIEKIHYLETILEDATLSLLRPVNAPDFYITAILSAISAMKQENIRPTDLAQIIVREEQELAELPRYHEKGAHKGKERSEYKKLSERIAKQQVLQAVYLRYEAMMRTMRRYDFDDMILETVKVLQEHESVRLDVQERYQYILADEHQDVNGAQNEILRLLTNFHESPNLFVVGDEKQAIYRFQGASLENFVYFETMFPATTVIRLTENYRSTQVVLDAAHALIKVDDGPLVDYRVPLTAQVATGVSVAWWQCAHESAEREQVVAGVLDRISAGATPAEIAVIVRSNREVASFSEALRRRGVLVDASADGDIMEHPLFRSALSLLEAVATPANPVVLARVFQAPYWHIPLADVCTVLAAQTYTTSLVRLLQDDTLQRALPLQAPEQVARVMSVVTNAATFALTASPTQVLAQVLAESGFLADVLGQDPVEGSRVVRRLYDEIEALVGSGEATTVSAVVSLLYRRQQYRIPLSAPFQKHGDGVQVMTAHKSKGLEFAHVFIPHVTAEGWGGSTRPDYFKLPLVKTAALTLEANEDERRLLYVAMTRAKESLVLSTAATNVGGKVLTPSPFLAVLPVVATTLPSLAAPALLTSLVSTDVFRQEVVAALHHSLSTRGISATSLNNAVKNPWHYLMRNVLRLPEPKTPALHFGTVMHAVLERVVEIYRTTGEVMDFATARMLCEQRLQQLPLSVVEFTDLFEKGQVSLAAYLPHLAGRLSRETKAEVSVTTEWVVDLPTLPVLRLTGNLDRLDTDETGRVSAVVDYKTGRPKSRREIAGETKSSDGNYLRQLQFYTVLLAQYEGGRYLTDTGVLSFIEPDSKGMIREETFVVTTDERQALTELLQSTVSTLLRADFLFDEALLAASEYADIGRLWQARWRM